jgi:hypothetical protein
MVYLRTKNPNLGKFSGPCIEKYWYVLRPFGMFNGYMGYFMTIWYILCSFGTFSCFFGVMHREKSGNPDRGARWHGSDHPSFPWRHNWFTANDFWHFFQTAPFCGGIDKVRRSMSTGWPDWANFRLLGDRSL